MLLLLERGGGGEGVSIRRFAARDAVAWELPLIVVRRFLLLGCELEAGLLLPLLQLMLLQRCCVVGLVCS